VDPREWKTRNDMTIDVGLGNGGKAEQFAQMVALGNFQKELVMGGKTNIVDDAKLYNTAATIAKIMGHKSPDPFFNDPSAKNPDGSPKYPPAPPAPDPKVQIAQMQQQGKQQEIAQKAQLDQVKSHTDAVHQQAKAQADIAVAQMKAELGAKLKMIDAFLKAQGMHQQMAHDTQQHHLDA